jgi:hypothetical protein
MTAPPTLIKPSTRSTSTQLASTNAEVKALVHTLQEHLTRNVIVPEIPEAGRTTLREEIQGTVTKPSNKETTEARELSRLRDTAKLAKPPGATKTSRGTWKHSAEMRERACQSVDRIKLSKPPHDSPDGSAVAKFSDQKGEETNETQKNETKTNTPKEGEQCSSDNRETQEHAESDNLLPSMDDSDASKTTLDNEENTEKLSVEETKDIEEDEEQPSQINAQQEPSQINAQQETDKKELKTNQCFKLRIGSFGADDSSSTSSTDSRDKDTQNIPHRTHCPRMTKKRTRL